MKLIDEVERIRGVIPPDMAMFLDNRLSGRVTHTDNLFYLQCSELFLEQGDSSIFLIGLGIRLCLIPPTLSFINYSIDPYQALEILHKSVKGVEVDASTVMIVFGMLAVYMMEHFDFTEESKTFTHLCLQKVNIPQTNQKLKMAHLFEYGFQRSRNMSHESALALFPSQIPGSLFLGDLQDIVKRLQKIDLSQYDMKFVRLLLVDLMKITNSVGDGFLSHGPRTQLYEATLGLYSALGILLMAQGAIANNNYSSMLWSFNMFVTSLGENANAIRQLNKRDMLFGQVTQGKTSSFAEYIRLLPVLKRTLYRMENNLPPVEDHM